MKSSQVRMVCARDGFPRLMDDTSRRQTYEKEDRSGPEDGTTKKPNLSWVQSPAVRCKYPKNGSDEDSVENT